MCLCLISSSTSYYIVKARMNNLNMTTLVASRDLKGVVFTGLYKIQVCKTLIVLMGTGDQVFEVILEGLRVHIPLKSGLFIFHSSGGHVSSRVVGCEPQNPYALSLILASAALFFLLSFPSTSGIIIV